MPRLTKNKGSKDNKAIRFNWQDNPSVEKILNVLVCILAEEYIQIARQNRFIVSSLARGETIVLCQLSFRGLLNGVVCGVPFTKNALVKV